LFLLLLLLPVYKRLKVSDEVHGRVHAVAAPARVRHRRHLRDEELSVAEDGGGGRGGCDADGRRGAWGKKEENIRRYTSTLQKRFKGIMTNWVIAVITDLS
jgi:hypothetical protein